MGALGRRLRALERRIGDKDFKSGAPPVDSEEMPDWDGSEPLSLDAYTRVLDGDIPDAELTEAEADARARLGPFAEVFERLERDEKAGVGT